MLKFETRQCKCGETEYKTSQGWTCGQCDINKQIELQKEKIIETHGKMLVHTEQAKQKYREKKEKKEKKNVMRVRSY